MDKTTSESVEYVANTRAFQNQWWVFSIWRGQLLFNTDFPSCCPRFISPPQFLYFLAGYTYSKPSHSLSVSSVEKSRTFDTSWWQTVSWQMEAVKQTDLLKSKKRKNRQLQLKYSFLLGAMKKGNWCFDNPHSMVTSHQINMLCRVIELGLVCIGLARLFKHSVMLAASRSPLSERQWYIREFYQ